MTNRYDASDGSEGQYQPGSNDKVLLNKLGITNAEEMDYNVLEKSRDAYFAAIKFGLNRNYEPLKTLIRQVLLDSAKNVSL